MNDHIRHIGILCEGLRIQIDANLGLSPNLHLVQIDMQLSRPFHRCGCRIGYDLDGVILFSGAIVIGITIACIDGITVLVHTITVRIGSPHHVLGRSSIAYSHVPTLDAPQIA